MWIAVITVGEAVVKQRVPVSLPSLFVSGTSEYATAAGTWIIEGERAAFPLQTTKIECVRSEQVCHVATAEVSFGGMMHVGLAQMPVREWGRTAITFSDSGGTCVSYTYTLNLHSKSVVGHRTRKQTAEPVCQGFAGELRLRLEDGFVVWGKEQEHARPWFERLALTPIFILR